jgi:hypothetical protein
MTCVICGGVMDPVLAPAVAHPTCAPFAEPGNEDPFAVMLKQHLTDMILWAEKQNPRASQANIGPSEIGDPCDRRIGYRLAQIPACNKDFDPWAAVMGTAVHTWLDNAVTAWSKEHGSTDWATETALAINEFVDGHSDLYWRAFETVIDWKTAGPDVMRKIKKDGPPPGYIIQAHIYGYGYEQKGWPVQRVALAFLSRAGWLRDMFIWSAPYDRSIAENAINRLYQIAHEVVSKDILKYSHRWEQIPATPSNSCGFCPWYNPGKEADTGADDQGCPGR